MPDDDELEDDELEAGVECEKCDNNIAQIEVENWGGYRCQVRRRGPWPDVAAAEIVFCREQGDGVTERLCIGCYVAKYGSDALSNKGVRIRIDVPGPWTRPDLGEEAEEWDRKYQGILDEIERRRVAIIMPDMFDESNSENP